jgi:hypothetical protein
MLCPTSRPNNEQGWTRTGNGLRRDKLYSTASVLTWCAKKDSFGSKLIQYSQSSQFSFLIYQCFSSRNSPIIVTFSSVTQTDIPQSGFFHLCRCGFHSPLIRRPYANNLGNLILLRALEYGSEARDVLQGACWQHVWSLLRVESEAATDKRLDCAIGKMSRKLQMICRCSAIA